MHSSWTFEEFQSSTRDPQGLHKGLHSTIQGVPRTPDAPLRELQGPRHGAPRMPTGLQVTSGISQCTSRSPKGFPRTPKQSSGTPNDDIRVMKGFSGVCQSDQEPLEDELVLGNIEKTIGFSMIFRVCQGTSKDSRAIPHALVVDL